MADIRHKTFNNFSSGLIDKFPAGDSRTPITALTSIVNMDVTEIGSLKKRKGFAQLGSGEITGSSAIYGLHYYGYQNQLLTVINTGLFKWDFDDATPSWSLVSTALTAHQETEFANALTDCWITNNTDTPQKYNGTTMTDSGAGTAPDNYRPHKAEFVIFKHNRLWYGDIEETDSSRYTSRYRYSGLRAIEGADAWPIDDWFDVELDDGDNISGLKEYRNNIVVVKNNSLHILKGTSKVDFGQFTYDTKIGCISNRTMREVEDKLFFLNINGVYTFDGIEIKPLSENIKTTFDEFTKSQMHYACGTFFDNKYMVHRVDTTLVYNTLSKSWTTYTNIAANDFAIYTPIDDENKLYFGGGGGVTGQTRKVFQLFTGDQDDGTDISANFTTTKFNCDTPFIKKQFHTVWAYAEGNASDSLTINYRLDYDTAWTPFTSTFDLGNKIQKFSFPAGEKHRGRNIQFQVVNTSSYNFEFKGFTLEYEEIWRA